MVTSKLPILAPGWGRPVFFLPLALDVGFLVLRRVEHGFCLLRRHSGNRLGSLGLVLARCGRRTRGLRLASATTATALVLPQRQLVIPPRIRISDGDFENLLVAIESAIERSLGGILCAESLDQIVEAEIEPRVMANFQILRIGRVCEWRYRRHERVAKQQPGARIVECNLGLVALASPAGGR